MQERLIVRLPKTKSKKGKNAKNQSKNSGVGASCGCGGCNGGRGHGRGSVPKEPASKSTKVSSRKSTRKRGVGCSTGSAGSAEYKVPNYVAVVTDGKGTKKKGYTPPENELAAGLAKYFESRTEIEYSVLVEKMKDLPEGQILDLLGIKGKAKKEDSKPKIEEKDEGLTPEDEKEADKFMAELKEQAKEKLEKEKTEREKKERKEKEKASRQQECNALRKLAKKTEQDEEEKLKCEAIKQQELKAQNLARKPKVKSPVKDCSVNMGKKVSNRSPVKVDISTDSDCMIINGDSNDEMKKKSKIARKEEGSIHDEPLNLSTGKRMANETDAASVTSSGVYFSDSDEFHKAVEMSKENNGLKVDSNVQEGTNVDNTVEETSDSGGVFFSDEEEFNRLKAITEKKNGNRTKNR